MKSCGCSSEEFVSEYDKPKKKGYLKIEGFSNMNTEEQSKGFNKQYKSYLESQKKEGLDKNAKMFYENFDENTQQLLEKNNQNNQIRDELQVKMKEIYNTIDSQSHEQQKIDYMYQARDLILYSVSAVVLYYVFIEL